MGLSAVSSNLLPFANLCPLLAQIQKACPEKPHSHTFPPPLPSFLSAHWEIVTSVCHMLLKKCSSDVVRWAILTVRILYTLIKCLRFWHVWTGRTKVWEGAHSMLKGFHLWWITFDLLSFFHTLQVIHHFYDYTTLASVVLITGWLIDALHHQAPFTASASPAQHCHRKPSEYNRFRQVQHLTQGRVCPLTTFGISFIFMFGQRAQTFSGVLLLWLFY